MTITETPADAAQAPAAAPAEATGLVGLVGSGDPRTIARLYIGASLLFLLLTGVTGMLIGVERVDSYLDDSYLQVFTVHSIGGVFLVAFPLLIGIMAAVVPLQIGAPTVAFPRALAASFWTYLVTGGLIIAAYLTNGGPYGGDAQGVDLFLSAFIGLLIALTTASIVLVATVLTLRAPGMSLRRAPLLAWSTVVGGVVWTLTLPVLAGLMVLVYVDHRYGNRLLLGGNYGIYDRITWMFRQPALYALAIPALGAVADIVPVFAQRRLRMHGVAMGAIGAFGALALGSWAQGGMSVTGSPSDPLPFAFEWPWIAVGVAAVLPVLIIFGLAADTLRLGKPNLAAPLALGLVGLLGIGGGVLWGALGVWEDLELGNSYWLTAQSHDLLSGTVIVALGALAFWAPKIWGVTLPDKPATGLAALAFVGAFPFIGADLYAGAFDPDDSTLDTLNVLELIGGGIFVVAAVGFVLLLVGSVLRKGDAPGDDPWAGHTLEWTTSSPPPVGNFASLPAITSEAPLYDARHGAAAAAASSEEAE